MDPSIYTEKPSEALKSSCKKHQEGLLSEKKVINLFKNKGYQLVRQRYRTPFGEVDLILRGKDHLLMIEVKSMKAFVYLSNKQKKSLIKSHEYLYHRYNMPIHFYLALVENNKIHIIPEDLTKVY